MTDTTVKIPYGLYVPTGRMIHIEAAANGDHCDCVCAECGWPLRARQGPVNVAHFSHQPDSHSGGGGGGGPCLNAPETALHKAAKQFFLDAGELMIPALTAKNPNGSFGRLVEQQRWVALVDPRKEPRDFAVGFVPDVVGLVDGEPLIIEIHVTHRVDAKKQRLIRQHGVSAIEIYLDPYRAMPEDTHRAIVLGSARRVWLWHIRQAAIDAELAAERAAAEAARQRAVEEAAQRQAELIARQRAEVAAADARRRAAQEAEQARVRQQWEADEAARRTRLEAFAQQMAEQEATYEERRRQEEAARQEARQQAANAILTWAEGYYPDRVTPPPDLSGLGPHYVEWLFQQVSNRRAYLALIDQPAVRHHAEAFSGEMARKLKARWEELAWPVV